MNVNLSITVPYDMLHILHRGLSGTADEEPPPYGNHSDHIAAAWQTLGSVIYELIQLREVETITSRADVTPGLMPR